MNSPDEEALRKMSFSELKKHAKEHGIKQNMKAEKIIALILSKKADEDSFVTLERKIINSCKKNKERLFEDDKKVVSDTPRRDTYTVEDPVTDIKNLSTSIIATSASPELKQSNKRKILNEKTASESAKKNRKSKRKVSFVTPLRRSARFFNATPQYSSLKGRPKTPIPNRLSSSKRLSSKGNKSATDSLDLDSSVDDVKISGNVKRPSTPMPISKQKRKRLSSLGQSDDALSPNLTPVSEVAPVLQELIEEACGETPNESFYATPSASSDIKQEKENFSKINENSKITTPLPSSTIKLKTAAQKTKASPKKTETPKKVNSTTPGLKKTTPFPSMTLVSMTPGFKPIKTPLTASGLKPTKTPLSKSKNTITIPALKLTSTPGLPLSTKKNIATPNFSKIHQEAFDKMESIGDYQKRKALNSAKKIKEQSKYHAPAKSNISKKIAAERIAKLPKTFSGIPFVQTKQTVKKNILKSSGLKPKVTTTASGLKHKIATTTSGLKPRIATTTSELKPKIATTTSGLKPRIATTTKSAMNTSSLSQKLKIAGNAKAIKKAAKENTPLKQRQKFDLRASLARKLTYKPHTGPVKPLNENKYQGNISTVLPPSKKFQTENEVVNNSRMETRDVLRGVRKNKRFLLQMNNRNQSLQQ